MISDLYYRQWQAEQAELTAQRRQGLPHVLRVFWARKVQRLGYFAVRQAMLKRHATMADVAWVLVTTLMIQGV